MLHDHWFKSLDSQFHSNSVLDCLGSFDVFSFSQFDEKGWHFFKLSGAPNTKLLESLSGKGIAPTSENQFLYISSPH